ncbi:MAG: hypothetical protein ACAF41_33340 (plasmid) [Leptolyngbya sp. BL-A-14]
MSFSSLCLAHAAYESGGDRAAKLEATRLVAVVHPSSSLSSNTLVHACCATLSRYRYLSRSKVIMDGNFLVSGEFEVMLSQGLGRYFEPQEKARLFQEAKQIADLLAMVMHRRTQAEKVGRPQPPAAIDHAPRA